VRYGTIIFHGLTAVSAGQVGGVEPVGWEIFLDFYWQEGYI
jgi:hypothetical protein